MTTRTTATAATTSVFWPNGCRRDGLCYGWLEPVVVVAGVLEDSTTSSALSSALLRSNAWQALTESCHGDPHIIGQCKFNNSRRATPIPSVLELWSRKTSVFSFVLYEPYSPQSLRFYTLDPPIYASTREKSKDLYRESQKHEFTSTERVQVGQGINEVVLNQLNSAFILQEVVGSSQSKPVKLLPPTATFLLTLASYLGVFSTLYLSLSQTVTSFTSLSVLPNLMDYIITGRSTSSPAQLKDISATIQHLDVRIQQGIFFITQVGTLQRQDTRNVSSYSLRYTNFFNAVWLIMNDLTIGAACGAYISEISEFLASYANALVQTWLLDSPRVTLYWLDAWPAGLKLNAQLSGFYLHILVGIVEAWASFLPQFTPSFFRALGLLSSIGGVTLLLSLLSDLLSLALTMHLRVGYELTRAVYWAAGVRLGGGLLWGVFRGKRRNVLRHRTDTWSYDIDQLLFGTVLFTLLAFLFPTALVYYALFASLRLAILLIQASIETLLAFMHHFPLFALVQRVKDPCRLPGGVYFTLRTSHTGPASDTVLSPPYLMLENQPISLSAIFFQYIELWQRLAHHYNPLRLLYRILSGQHLSSIPMYSIRYTSSSGADSQQNATAAT